MNPISTMKNDFKKKKKLKKKIEKKKKNWKNLATKKEKKKSLVTPLFPPRQNNTLYVVYSYGE